ncbi:hypothetical protein CAPTEDRAFT_214356 [Capitella teleta]|uniref:G-protein coupled receptors family 1 profile domain-containing protein n=1 Tax=Capitella teleta TaxID=283909 RepID=R7U0N2_CAPTE|nr:hypothetical protein CAPTEDRAFT_214356 [Capitella teleta]|eukprot:ELT99758.1 hypothetical protein CAPTEDRAFT_214356 [Capitella teleta]
MAGHWNAAFCIFQLQKFLQLFSVNEHAISFLNNLGGTLSLAGFLASNGNAFLISVDRAYSTLAPFKYKSAASIQRASIILSVAWTSAILLIVIPIAINIAPEGGTANLNYPYDLLPYSYGVYLLSPLLLLGTATNVVLYVVIVISFFKMRKKILPATSSLELRNRRMTRTVTMVIGTLLIGNIPIITMAAMLDNPHVPYLWSYEMFYDIAILCSIIPTFLNNFLYVWQLPDFNIAVIRLLSCHRNGIASFDTDISNRHVSQQRA